MAWALATLLLLVSPSRAEPEPGPLPQEHKITACLSRHSGNAIPCIGIMLSPCAHQRLIGFDRACYAKLGRIWYAAITRAEEAHAEIAALKRAWPGRVWYDQTRQTAFTAFESKCHAEVRSLAANRTPERHAVRNACYLIERGVWWYRIAHAPNEVLRRRRAFLADVESLEACLLESGAAGHADQCSGLFRDACEHADPLSRSTCLTFANLLWFEVLVSAVGPERADRISSDASTRAFSRPRAQCRDYSTCVFETFRDLTIDAFLEAELR